MLDTDWHTFPVTVYIEDTDMYGVVYHANYIKYFERGRTEWLKQQGLNLSDTVKKGYFLVVTHLDVDFKKKASLDAVLIVKTRLHKMRHAVARFHQEVIDGKTDKLIAKATVQVACIDKNEALCKIRELFNEE